MPVMLKLPGGEEQAKLVEKWLRGELEIPEIASKWSQGAAVAIELVAPKEVGADEAVTVRAVITSNKVGHDFPTGPLDIIQAWVELSVTDALGRVVFASGRRDDQHRIEPGTFMFKAEPVDQYGNLIDRHNLWEMVGVRYRRSLFPGFSDTAEYSFACSGNAERRAPELKEKRFSVAPGPAIAGDLTVTARLMYRKIDQYLLNFLFGENAGLTTPVTEMARAESRIRVRPAAPKQATRGAAATRMATLRP
jgi:hypothetical protein